MVGVSGKRDEASPRSCVQLAASSTRDSPGTVDGDEKEPAPLSQPGTSPCNARRAVDTDRPSPDDEHALVRDRIVGNGQHPGVISSAGSAVDRVRRARRSEDERRSSATGAVVGNAQQGEKPLATTADRVPPGEGRQVHAGEEFQGRILTPAEPSGAVDLSQDLTYSDAEDDAETLYPRDGGVRVETASGDAPASPAVPCPIIDWGARPTRSGERTTSNTEAAIGGISPRVGRDGTHEAGEGRSGTPEKEGALGTPGHSVRTLRGNDSGRGQRAPPSLPVHECRHTPDALGVGDPQHAAAVPERESGWVAPDRTTCHLHGSPSSSVEVTSLRGESLVVDSTAPAEADDTRGARYVESPAGSTAAARCGDGSVDAASARRGVGTGDRTPRMPGASRAGMSNETVSEPPATRGRLAEERSSGGAITTPGPVESLVAEPPASLEGWVRQYRGVEGSGADDGDAAASCAPFARRPPGEGSLAWCDRTGGGWGEIPGLRDDPVSAKSLEELEEELRSIWGALEDRVRVSIAVPLVGEVRVGAGPTRAWEWCVSRCAGGLRLLWITAGVFGFGGGCRAATTATSDSHPHRHPRGAQTTGHGASLPLPSPRRPNSCCAPVPRFDGDIAPGIGRAADIRTYRAEASENRPWEPADLELHGSSLRSEGSQGDEICPGFGLEARLHGRLPLRTGWISESRRSIERASASNMSDNG